MTSGHGLPPITSVTGGVGGLAASYDAVRRLARHYDDTAGRLRDGAATAGRVLGDPALLESAVLSPVTFAAAEASVAGAASGLHGCLPASLACTAGGDATRAAVAALEECDLAVAASMHAVDYTVGRSLGVDALALAPVALVVGALDPVAVRTAERWVETSIERHPELTQHALDGSGGLLDGLLSAVPPGLPVLLGLHGAHPTSRSAAADVAGLYAAEGAPQVRRRRDLWSGLGDIAPHSVCDLMDHLGRTDALSPPEAPGDQGTIEVQRLAGRDGTVRWVVYLPGTDDMATTPWSQDGDVRDLPANLHLIAGEDTTYQRGIEAAMARAGIGPRDPVLLAGHSQGGMEAAAMLAHGSPYRITHVVTAGSPIGEVHGYPRGAHVLSLENDGDVVPLLDGHDNADTVEQVTVRFDDHEASLIGNHAMSHYVHGAAAVDASDDPSVREQVRTLRPFFSQRADASSRIFQITR